jgi:hypothetical protein
MYNKPGAAGMPRSVICLKFKDVSGRLVGPIICVKKCLIEMIAISLFGSMRVGSQSFGNVSTPRLRTTRPLPDPLVPAFSLNSNDGTDKSQNAGEI